MNIFSHAIGFAVILTLCVCSTLSGASQDAEQDYETIVLWPNGAPGNEKVQADGEGAAQAQGKADVPTLLVYRPPADQANQSAIVILPGGGYGGLAIGHEGHQIAQWFNQRGVTAYILQYRHAPKYHHPIPLTDAKRALRYVRYHAKANGIRGDRIGVMGFSAGGHLASTLGTQFDAGDSQAADPIDRVSCRPDFMILCYPVITFLDEPAVHKGSRRNLLGDDPPTRLVREMSSETRVTGRTPPTFLFHTDQDAGVPPENSILFYQALRRAKVPAELHIYRVGGHGVGFAQNQRLLAGWPDVLETWLGGLGLLER